jgi:hypothetical protein
MAPLKTRLRNAVVRALLGRGASISEIISAAAAAVDNNIDVDDVGNLSINEFANLLFAKSETGRKTPIINYQAIASLTPELKAIFDDLDDFRQFQRPWNELCNEHSNGGEVKQLIDQAVIREQNNAAARNGNGSGGNNDGDVVSIAGNVEPSMPGTPSVQRAVPVLPVTPAPSVGFAEEDRVLLRSAFREVQSFKGEFTSFQKSVAEEFKSERGRTDSLVGGLYAELEKLKGALKTLRAERWTLVKSFTFAVIVVVAGILWNFKDGLASSWNGQT